MKLHNMSSHCRYPAARRRSRTRYEQSSPSDTPRGNRHSRNACRRRKKKPRTHHAPGYFRRLRAQQSVRRISRDARWNGLLRPCCHRSSRSTPRHPARSRSTPCRRPHMPYSLCTGLNQSKTQSCSCSLPLLRLQEIECSFPSRSASRHDVADQRLRLHDPDVWLLRDGQQIIGDISSDYALISPVIRQPDLVYCPAFYRYGTHTRCNQHTRLDQSTRRSNGREVAVLKANIFSTLRRDLAEQFWLQFREV